MRNALVGCLALLTASVLTAILLFASVVGGRATQAADVSKAKTDKPSKSTAKTSVPHIARLKPNDHAVVDDIAEIRRRVGIDLFSDTSLKAADDAAASEEETNGEFRNALIRLVPPRENDVVRANAWANCESDYARAVIVEQSAESDFVSALDEAGRLLELKALQLDLKDDHDRAAQLRTLAGELRKQAALEQQP